MKLSGQETRTPTVKTALHASPPPMSKAIRPQPRRVVPKPRIIKETPRKTRPRSSPGIRKARSGAWIRRHEALKRGLQVGMTGICLPWMDSGRIVRGIDGSAQSAPFVVVAVG